MRLLVDMNLSPAWCPALVAAGLEAVHWQDVGAHDAPDSALMQYAVLHHCVVLTHDLDFGAILAATQSVKPSVVQIRAEDVSFEAIGPQVIAAIRQLQGELTSGALVTVEPLRTRARILPFRI